MWNYRAYVTKIVDGDTIDVNIDLGFKIMKEERLRVAGVDTPEIRGEERPEGLIAKEFVEQAIPVGTYVEVTTEKTGKYGRYIANIAYWDAAGVQKDLSEELLKEGLAEPYPA